MHKPREMPLRLCSLPDGCPLEVSEAQPGHMHSGPGVLMGRMQGTQ